LDPLGLAVVGTGRAGQARLRAIAEHPDARLIAAVRHTAGPGEPQLPDVLANPAVDALVLCTPNLLHAPVARAALEAGKHVLVEFPLAPAVAPARELFALAQRRGRVLHVEHIELLAPSQLAQRERRRGLGALIEGELRFTGAAEGWIADERLAGSPALRAVARLHRLVDLFGDCRVESAALERSANGYRLEVELSALAGGRLRLVEARGPDLARGTHWSIQCAQGRLDDPPHESPGGLFQQDLACFVARVRSGAPSYVSEARVLDVLALVEQIDARTL
jgi:biliverdin reductase